MLRSSSHDNYHPGIPSSYVEFVTVVLGVKLSPEQRVLCAVCFDGVEPKELHGADRSIAHQLFGDVEAVPKMARAVITALIGARSGKSYLFSLRLLHLAFICALRTLAPGEQAFGLLVAPDMRLARGDLRYVAGAAHAAPLLAGMIIAETTDALTFRRADGRVVTIECLPATRGGSAVRGRSLFAAFLDEAAFFRDSNFVVNDDEVYKAIAPRVTADGQFLIASTPWAEAGLLYELFKSNHGQPQTSLSAHATTEMLRSDSPEILEQVERERINDPENARREFDAQPMGGGAVHFFDPAALAACIDESLPAISARSNVFERACMGLDTGFRKNPSGGVVVRERSDKTLLVSECVEITPPKGGRLVPSETMKALMERAKFHYCTQVVADQHYIETVREYTGSLTLVEAPSVPAEAYVATRDAIAEGRVRISAQHQRLISQLREVVSKPTAGGNISISSPNRGTSHGDVASAFVLAVWKIAQAGTTALKGEAARSQTSRNLDEHDPMEHRRRALDNQGGGTVRRIRGPLD